MVELKNKYKIGVRRFQKVNWIGLYTLYKKETLRFLSVFGQTIIGPVVPAILFLLVIALACMTIAPRYIPAYEVEIFFVLETILGPIWVWLVIDEQPSIETLLGGIVIIITIAFIHMILGMIIGLILMETILDLFLLLKVV